MPITTLKNNVSLSTLEKVKSKITETRQGDLIRNLKQSNLYYHNLEEKYMEYQMRKKEINDSGPYLKEISRLRKQLAETVKLARMSAVVNRNYAIMTKEFSRICRGHYANEIRGQMLKRSHLFNMARDIDRKTKSLIKSSNVEVPENDRKVYTMADGAGFADLMEAFQKLRIVGDNSDEEDPVGESDWESDEGSVDGNSSDDEEGQEANNTGKLDEMKETDDKILEELC